MRQAAATLLLRCLLVVPAAGFASGCAPDRGATPPAADPTETPRIVTLAPHLTELVYAAGAGAQLVGVVEYSDFPPQARELPRVGDAFRLDFEALAARQPDLVLAWPSGNSPTLLRHLAYLGYRVIELEPAGLDSIPAQIQLIGELAGTQAQAHAMASGLRQRLAALRAMHAQAAPLRVFYQVAARPLLTINRRHILSDALATCGATNVFAGLPELVPTVSQEAVIATRPEAIVTTYVPGDDARQGAADALADWRSWRGLPAVAHHNLFAVDADLLSRPTPRMLEGVAELCALLDVARLRLASAAVPR